MGVGRFSFLLMGGGGGGLREKGGGGRIGWMTFSGGVLVYGNGIHAAEG